MPYRALAITSRHHPVAVGCYVGLTVLAGLYLLGIARVPSLTSETSAYWVRIWQISLLGGGLLSIAGILAPTSRLLSSLVLEAFGTFVLGIELGLYTIVLMTMSAPPPWASVMVFGAVAIGCLCRTWTALRDRKRVIAGVRASQMATTLWEPE